jgi:serine protease Do
MNEQTQSRLKLIVGIVGGSLVIAILGTIGTLYFLSATPSGEKIRQHFGLENLKVFNIQTNKSEKIIVEESSAIIDASKKVNPAVVSITSIGQATRDVFGFGVIQAPQTAGTGFIVTSDGLIVTNKHVISTGQKFTVTTANSKTYDGKVVAQDPSNDIALVKIEATGLPVADLGDTDKVQVGQWVIAIGNALGELQNTVTVGVISAKERTASPSDGQGNTETLYGLLQTDAAINPGNSGGPLLSLAGQVVGINTAIAGNGAENIGFAIPVEEISKDLQSYSKNGKIIQPYIGVRYQSITTAVAKASNLPVEKGALIIGSSGQAAIASGSPAEKAGLKANDIITKVNNDAIDENNPLTRLIRKYNPGDKVTFTILRDGKEQKVDVTLGSL